MKKTIGPMTNFPYCTLYIWGYVKQELPHGMPIQKGHFFFSRVWIMKDNQFNPSYKPSHVDPKMLVLLLLWPNLVPAVMGKGAHV